MMRILFYTVILVVVVAIAYSAPSAHAVCVQYDITATWDETQQEHVFDYTCEEYHNG
jgi:hypothetical protein